jgi:hypothetical protein
MLFFQKRYNKEVDYHKNIINIKHYNKDIFSKPTHSVLVADSKYIATFIMLVDNSIYNIDIKVSNDYPFKPPQININKKCYSEFLNETSILLKKNNKLDICCLCCNSILMNWQPGYGFTAILNEINNHIINRKKIINNIIAKKIMKKKLGFIIPTLYDFL